MKIELYGKTYDVNSSVFNSSRNLIQEFLDNIKAKSEDEKIPGFYTSCVLMMYIVSSVALKEMSLKDLQGIVSKDDNKGE